MTLDANSSAPSLRVPAHVERKIAARWKEWEPQVRAWMLTVCDTRFDEFMGAAYATYRTWLLSLLRDDIEMKVIRRNALDDIREPLSELTRRRDAAMARAAHPRYTNRRSPNVTYSK